MDYLHLTTVKREEDFCPLAVAASGFREQRYRGTPQCAGVYPVWVQSEHAFIEPFSVSRRLEQFARIGQIPSRCLDLRRVVECSRFLVAGDNRGGSEGLGDVKRGKPLLDARDTTRFRQI